LKVIWAILCQSSAVDRDTNVVSLFNVIEDLTLSAPPPEAPPGQQLPAGLALVPPFRIVALWSRSNPDVPEQGRGRMRLLLPKDGSVARTQEFDVDLTQHLRLRHIMNLSGLPLGGEGIYRFVIDGMTGTSEWTEKFELPLHVAFQRQDSG
jgi:hypothetical protein